MEHQQLSAGDGAPSVSGSQTGLQRPGAHSKGAVGARNLTLATQEVHNDLSNVCALLMGLQSVLHEEGLEGGDADRIARVAFDQIKQAQSKLQPQEIGVSELGWMESLNA